MRPTLKALAEQQAILDAQGRSIDRIARLAGVDLSDIKRDASRKISALRKRADEDNPAQPVPEPAADAPAATSDGTLAEIPSDSPETPGASPVTDVSPDGVTTPLAAGGTVADDPINLGEMGDVTAPVEGTTEQRPASETITSADVDAGVGVDGEVAHPLTGEFAEQQTVASQSRTFASLRLARLRIQAGIEIVGDDLSLGERIAGSQATDAEIAAEIKTLDAVVSANGRRADRPAHLVPRSAGTGRATPSMAPPAPAMEELAVTAGQVTDDEVLFEG